MKEDELKDITEFTNREKAYILVKWNGLRDEKVLELTRYGFDFAHNSIYIHNTVTFIDNKPVIKSTKTESRKRILPILEHVRAFFIEYVNNLTYRSAFHLTVTYHK